MCLEGKGRRLWMPERFRIGRVILRTVQDVLAARGLRQSND
jgi:hypothetical protein